MRCENREVNRSMLFRLYRLFAFLAIFSCAGSTFVRAQRTEATTATSSTVRYVAPNGNDAWSGTLAAPNRAHTDGPFATFERALKALSGDAAASTPAGGSPARILEVRGGTYSLRAPIMLTAANSGVTIRGYRGEAVRLQGGQSVGGWKPVTDAAILLRLDPAARSHIVQTDLRAQGVTDFGTLTTRGFGRPTTPAPLELFWGDAPMTIAVRVPGTTTYGSSPPAPAVRRLR